MTSDIYYVYRVKVSQQRIQPKIGVTLTFDLLVKLKRELKPDKESDLLISLVTLLLTFFQQKMV